jgi:hypothetical protein
LDETIDGSIICMCLFVKAKSYDIGNYDTHIVLKMKVFDVYIHILLAIILYSFTTYKQIHIISLGLSI